MCGRWQQEALPPRQGRLTKVQKSGCGCCCPVPGGVPSLTSVLTSLAPSPPLAPSSLTFPPTHTSPQVLGITNYSHWSDAGELRACMWGGERVRSQLLDVALARINKFVHVGSTGRLMDSVAAAAVRNLRSARGREQACPTLMGRGGGRRIKGASS